jgi:D-arabinose 1-dehydrogenase-like Zn-dependent alcohol dehydrogenase
VLIWAALLTLVTSRRTYNLVRTRAPPELKPRYTPMMGSIEFREGGSAVLECLLAHLGYEEFSEKEWSASFPAPREGTVPENPKRQPGLPRRGGTVRAARFSGKGSDLEVVETPTPTPRSGQLLIRVQACGVCHSDLGVRAGNFPGLAYPRIPGHEVVGTVEALGPGVSRWKAGDRVGIGWHGGHDGTCGTCRRGDFFACPHQQITGISFDGGYAEFMLAPADSVAAVPSEIPAPEAAVVMCAGVTTFNALRHSPARPGDVVAILGLGGLGHLAVQYAARMGFYTIALGRGTEKEALARQFGAREYLDTQAAGWIDGLTALGGARVILATAPDAKGIADAVEGLSVHGEMLVVGVPAEPVSVAVRLLTGGRRSIRGWYSGWAPDIEDALRFGLETGVRAMTETFPLARAAEGLDRMARGTVRFRSVLVTP